MWAAKLCPRRTMKYPIAPASIATRVPTTNAFCMKWNCSSSWMSASRSQVKPCSGKSIGLMSVIAHRLVLADHDESPVARSEDLDRRPVQTGQGFGGDHLFRFAANDVALRDVNHAVQKRKDRIDVVRDQENGDLHRLAYPLDQA